MLLQRLKYIFPVAFLSVLLVAWLALHKVPIEFGKMHAAIIYSPPEVARMNYKMQGCFGGYSAEIIIYEETQNTFSARLNIDNRLHATTRLNIDQLHYFKEFVSTLKEQPVDTWCSTSQTYRVVMPHFRLEKQVGCDESGFDELRKVLFAS